MSETNTLEAYEGVHGWSVLDTTSGGTWWPDDDAAAEIATSDDPAETVIRICRDQPMRGEWNT